METKIFQELQTLQEELSSYHGAKKLQNIPELTSSELFKDLNVRSQIDLPLDLTVNAAIQKIHDVLSAESVFLQFKRFQEQRNNHNILPSQRLPENQRLEFYRSKNTHEWLEIMFSPQEHYFTINSKSFKKGDKLYNREIFQQAIDTVIIDPEKVADSSLENLGIILDPDCQNLKEIFKQMHPLNYQDAEEKKFTIRINEYEGKYIVFAANKQVFDAQQPATKGEQKKEDVKGHMSVYPDIFSMIRREEHIIETAEDKQIEYKEIKKKLIASIKDIDRNKKAYSISVQKNVQEIIEEIDKATSAKIVADKLYHLYKITGKHSEVDKKHLEASMHAFTKRIAQLIGISAHTQLHVLTLNDALEDQARHIGSFHAQVAMSNDSKALLLAFENYYHHRVPYTKEPFVGFARQIRSVCGSLKDIQQLDSKMLTRLHLKASLLANIQNIILNAYMMEHEMKLHNFDGGEYLSMMSTINEYAIEKDSLHTKQLYEHFFADIRPLLEKIGEILKEEADPDLRIQHCCKLLKDIRKLPSLKDKIATLQSF